MTDAELEQYRHDGELLRSIVSEKVKLGRYGSGRWRGCCPFHDDKTPSFTMYADGHFRCYGCQKNGSVFDFVMFRDGVEFRDAIKIIEKHLGLTTGDKQKRKPNNGAGAHNGDAEFRAIIPPPRDAPAPLDQLNGRYQAFEYVTAEGETHHYQRRIGQGGGKKMFVPLTFGTLNGIAGWHAKAPPQPWPLYRLDLLTSADPDSRVIVVEGEGTCEAAERLFPGYLCTTWMSGAGSVDCSDWEPLKRFREENLIWWPDADRPSADGKPHGCFIAEAAFRKRFPCASYIDTSGLSERKDGYDAADLEDEVGDDDPEAWLTARLKTPPSPGDDARSEDDPGPRPGSGSTGSKAASFRDPWANPQPPVWPKGVLGSRFDEMVEQRAIESGIDPAAIGLSTLCAVSGAAPKNTVIAPYGMQREWRQPPIIWVMIVGESGFRKSAIERAFRTLTEIQVELMAEYRAELEAWETAPLKGKPRKPAEPHMYNISDPSLESLQDVLAASDRGTLLYRDELAGWFNGFQRYGAHDYRQWALQGYDGRDATVTRVKRGRLFIKVNGFTVCGSIQPDRLAGYKDLDDDGFGARFIVFWMRPVTEAQLVPFIPAAEVFDERIGQLAELDGGRSYEPTAAGIAIIRQMEHDALGMAALNDFGKGFSGFCRKLHGTLARCTVILHLLDNPDPLGTVIPDSTVIRADRLVRGFILPAAVAHYRATAPEAQRTRDIASWLLTSAPQEIRASDFAANIRSCRNLTTKELRDALDPLLTGGWLEPENHFQENRRWILDLQVRQVLAARVIAEQARKEEMRAMWERIAGGEDDA